MADIIQLLPDSIANQIAAGEVIQRPASVVKELMENAIDAGATEVAVIIRDAGKTLIQVIDNGSGMSETDARLSFERHATSKIRQASDLFSIRTKGFRGEALASVAAIAHVEMITRQHGEELGALLQIEGSAFKKQEFCQAHVGTKISVKNLFYNVPARRKFLKTDSVELKHLTDEFMRIAIAHENIKFTLHHNEKEMYHLPKAKLMPRLVSIFGKKFGAGLVPVSEETDVVRLSGYVGKPDLARRSRQNQFIFVNNRFIRNNYLGHAIRMAYEQILSQDLHPVYFVFLEIDPDKIDVNIHPTKQEIKFEEERLIYNYLRVAVRQALGRYSMTPLLDFERKDPFDDLLDKRKGDFTGSPGNKDLFRQKEQQDWERLFEGLSQSKGELELPSSRIEQSRFDFADNLGKENYPEEKGFDQVLIPDQKAFQVHGSYIICQIRTGLMIIDQKNAHERILYERYLQALSGQNPVSQQSMFPVTIELSPGDAEVFVAMLPGLHELGFIIEHFGHHTYIVKGLPVGIEQTDPQSLIVDLVEQYSANKELRLGINENLARSFAVSSSIRRKKTLSVEEMQQLIDELFACENPYTSPAGHKCFVSYSLEDMERVFFK